MQSCQAIITILVVVVGPAVPLQANHGLTTFGRGVCSLGGTKDKLGGIEDVLTPDLVQMTNDLEVAKTTLCAEYDAALVRMIKHSNLVSSVHALVLIMTQAKVKLEVETTYLKKQEDSVHSSYAATLSQLQKEHTDFEKYTTSNNEQALILEEVLNILNTSAQADYIRGYLLGMQGTLVSNLKQVSKQHNSSAHELSNLINTYKQTIGVLHSEQLQKDEKRHMLEMAITVEQHEQTIMNRVLSHDVIIRDQLLAICGDTQQVLVDAEKIWSEQLRPSLEEALQIEISGTELFQLVQAPYNSAHELGTPARPSSSWPSNLKVLKANATLRMEEKIHDVQQSGASLHSLKTIVYLKNVSSTNGSSSAKSSEDSSTDPAKCATEAASLMLKIKATREELRSAEEVGARALSVANETNQLLATLGVVSSVVEASISAASTACERLSSAFDVLSANLSDVSMEVNTILVDVEACKEANSSLNVSSLYTHVSVVKIALQKLGFVQGNVSQLKVKCAVLKDAYNATYQYLSDEMMKLPILGGGSNITSLQSTVSALKTKEALLLDLFATLEKKCLFGEED